MATDIDSMTNSQLTYSVSDGNFTVQTVNNVGYIRTAQSVYSILATCRHQSPCAKFPSSTCDCRGTGADLASSHRGHELVDNTETETICCQRQRLREWVAKSLNMELSSFL